MKAKLILENGVQFCGESIGATADTVFELVFCTAMTGYQEILTDPSYAGQGVLLCDPLIGNYGVNSEDNQSATNAAALIVRHLAPRGSNFRCEGTLDDFLKEHHITGVQGVDTRALTRILRKQGTMNAMVTCAEDFCMETALEALRAYRVGAPVPAVTCGAKTEFAPEGAASHRVALLDCGVKTAIVENLTRRGCAVTVYPAHTSAETILADHPQGILLSNGPGDPAENQQIICEVKKLYSSGVPVLAIGLGHQLLALATGATTEKLHHGHRGGSYPVRQMATGRVYVTAQNHGYGVVRESVDPAIAAVSYENVNDQSVEGLRYPTAISVQFCPEGVPGALDTEFIFDEFVAQLEGGLCNA